MTKIKLTENTLRQMVREAIEDIVSNKNDKERDIEKQKQIWAKEERALYSEFLTYLENSKVNGVGIKQHLSGSLCISIPTDEYNNHARAIANSFAKRKNMWINDEVYPATTYLYLEKQYGR